MAEVRRGEENQGIKLFGATITLHGGDVKEGKKGNEDRTVEKCSEKIIACPRCKSMETKFCYFNNYNVNQPRHFCKSCQRYWTAGGALRNVPIGAGRRKAKPPCPGDGSSPDSCVYENSDDGHVFGLEQGLLLDKWHVAVPHSDFRQVFPGKRRRTTSVAKPDPEAEPEPEPEAKPEAGAGPVETRISEEGEDAGVEIGEAEPDPEAESKSEPG